MFNLNNFLTGTIAREYFRGCGSFGEICGNVERSEGTIVNRGAEYEITCTYEKDAYGVFTRKDVFRNTSDHPIRVNALKSRFVFDGSEYQVYTQFNNWQHESTGAWQELVTSVSVASASTRLTMGGTPFMVLWNEQAHRGVALHLIPNGNWEIRATRTGAQSKHTNVVVDLGLSDYGMDVQLQSGESLELPEVLCYEVRNKLDCDCWKLHNYMHTRAPRKAMPMLYNTWLCRFDNLDYDVLIRQAELAAEMGLEYYLIDAGWFGKGAAWSLSVGDWKENQTGALYGKMIEVADKVRSLGMKFGLWLEPERAVPTADNLREHPEYYFKGGTEAEPYYFLDFGNDEARQWMLQIIFDLIDHYGIEYIKDDYNADLFFDPKHTSFTDYHAGHAKFIQAIRDRYPNIYLTNCGSGGIRLDLRSYMLFDSAWPSDNESPYIEMRMYRDTILRMPPQGFERWIAAHSVADLKDFYQCFQGSNSGKLERMVACGDAVWHHLVGVQDSFMQGYMTGGPVGFSCDLRLLSDRAREMFKEEIAQIKADREFWKTAVARILTDTKTVTTFQYSDVALTRIVVQLFTHETMQQTFRVYPVVDEAASYRTADGAVLTGRQIAEEGIGIATETWLDNWHEMFQITLEKI
ncbi:MAG: alpha-galactosidase [Oscillospiraceae bacterium]|nr:alpha-galactosidase [Oscillospiraceae bacterium]